MKKAVFIDGQHGTTGLKIHERLGGRDDLELVEIPVEQKKDIRIKEKVINEVDIVFLCLPDDAARESVSLVRSNHVRVLDTSTAHRTARDWVYGIPELNPEQRDKIRQSKRVSVPGCYATGFNICMHPLVAQGIVPSDYPINCYAITGYSGGGKQMIAAFEKPGNDTQEICCRPKNLNLAHKHLPEMQQHGLLSQQPVFTPIVGNFFRGMLVFIPLHVRFLTRNQSSSNIRTFFEEYYKGEQFIRVASQQVIEEIGDGFLSPVVCNETNYLDLFVFDKNDHVLLVARLDNLGKGASGAAVQNMNLLIGAPENKGL